MTSQLMPSAEIALSTVGARTQDVIDAIRPYRGEPYLVGSLAVGLGDKRSDVDVHVVAADSRPVDGPLLAFTAAGTCIDVRCVRRWTIDRMLAAEPGHQGPRPAGRGDAWMLSRWLNAVPLRPGAPPLLTAPQRDRATELIILSLTADLITLTAFAQLAEQAGTARPWYLCRRAGTAAWELAATLTGQDYLGERWLPARSTDPAVAAFAERACAVQQAIELDELLHRLNLSPGDPAERVRLHVNPEAERWNLAGRQYLLVASRRLVPRVAPVPATVAAALTQDPAAVFEGLVSGALRWSADVSGITPHLGSPR